MLRSVRAAPEFIIRPNFLTSNSRYNILFFSKIFFINRSAWKVRRTVF
ncbi:hypothetical protein [Leptospira noguchii]|uniref:Uncharacterized protein n=1 Tax=Leptospira noguchii TaxID=28182 RepID=A0AAE9GF66_9LEPT|nr:hypothetical protein [Leptospira noguchii]UOG56958.1 hypothetical protein MAL03_01670 [Leptospira noguchii]